MFGMCRKLNYVKCSHYVYPLNWQIVSPLKVIERCLLVMMFNTEKIGKENGKQVGSRGSFFPFSILETVLRY